MKLASLLCLLITSTVLAANRGRIENLCTPSESDIKENRIVISPDSNLVAWWGGNGETIQVLDELFFSKDAQAAMFINDHQGPVFKTLAKAVFSADSRHVAYFASDDTDGALLVVDGKKIKDGIGGYTRYPVFSPSGREIAYAGSFEAKKYRVVHNGQKSEPYDDIGEIVFSDDDAHLAFGAKRGDKWFVVRDGVESKNLFDGLGADSLRFSHDGKHLVYTGTHDNKWNLVIDEKPSPDLFSIGTGGVHISSDSKVISFVVIKAKNQETCIVNGKPGREYNTIEPILFSREGHHCAYLAGDKDGWRVVHDFVEDKAYDDANDPLFSRDGKHLVYRALKGEDGFVVIDGVPQSPYRKIRNLAISDDADHVGFSMERDRKTFIVIDGQESGPFDSVEELELSPEGAHWAAWVKQGSEYQMFVDGQQAGSFDSLLKDASIVFDGEQSVHGLAVRDKSIDRVQVDFVESRPWVRQ